MKGHERKSSQISTKPRTQIVIGAFRIPLAIRLSVGFGSRIVVFVLLLVLVIIVITLALSLALSLGLALSLRYRVFR